MILNAASGNLPGLCFCPCTSKATLQGTGGVIPGNEDVRTATVSLQKVVGFIILNPLQTCLTWHLRMSRQGLCLLMAPRSHPPQSMLLDSTWVPSTLDPFGLTS